jgi:thioredoxin 2
VLVDLWAPWCGPCRIVEPGVEQAASSLAGRLKAVKVNVDQAPKTAERLGVQGIPTLLLLRDGREVARQVGAVPPAALLRWVEEAIARQAA